MGASFNRFKRVRLVLFKAQAPNVKAQCWSLWVGEACKCETCECQSPVFLNWESPEFQSSEVQRCTGSQVSKCKVFNMHRWVAGWVVGWLVGWRRYTITNVSGETENKRRFLCLWGHWLRLHVASKAHACYGAVSSGAVGPGFKSRRARQLPVIGSVAKSLTRC